MTASSAKPTEAPANRDPNLGTWTARVAEPPEII